jgi:UDP-glucose 4-epimerase
LVALNIGTGTAHSVLEVVGTFEHACGRPIARTMGARGPGDIAASCADMAQTERLLGWRPARGLAAICADAWRWQKNGARY